jgi:hypothetical protein
MTTSIFIKTWSGDTEWLKYCLASIEKYATGIHEVVIVADASCANTVFEIAGDHRVEVVYDWPNGYIQQQWFKLNADKFTESDYVLYVDCDCIFTTPFSPDNNCMVDGKPILLKTDYQVLGDTVPWQAITSDFTGWHVDYEYMRRMPWMCKSSSLVNFRAMFPKTHEFLLNMQNNQFSEFNVLGAYIDKFEKDQYYIWDTAVGLPKLLIDQFWSWGGVTPNVRKRIEEYLGISS